MLSINYLYMALLYGCVDPSDDPKLTVVRRVKDSCTDYAKERHVDVISPDSQLACSAQW